MKKLIVFLIAFLGLVSCAKDIDYSGNVRTNVQQVFGVSFPETQDWIMTTNSTVEVSTDLPDIVKIQIVASFKEDSIVHLTLLNETKGNKMTFDVPNNYSNLYAVFVNKENHRYYKKFKLGDSKVDLSKNTTRGIIVGWEPSYPIPSITPIINAVVPTYANERHWIEDEVFYKYDYETTDNEGYDEDFVTLFRDIIFNYFPNGKKYDNLPKIKKSGYYNENVYPITTGDEPIVISPVYKNDGGYYEISKAELYYYYFKGDLTPAEIEALPKYRAIDLSEVYLNGENDEVVKKPSYVLAFFGDGTPEEGAEGSYKFDPGYKIGFVYKSNTHIDKSGNREIEIGDKKQGELYGDGRLNYNINNWKNFASSKLGPTDPRMAWMSVNDKMFLCVESGTDRDYNDLILEVEGGIEPIIIDPDNPEYNSYVFCYEDHRLGDYDMNDVVLKGERIDDTHVKWTLMATGAHDELYIFNVDGDNINNESEVHDILGKERKTFINTEEGDNTTFVSDIVEVDKNYSFLNPETQPYIWDATQNWEVKIARRGEDPHAIMIPYDFRWPLEKVRITWAYYDFNSWGTKLIDETDWFKYPVEGMVF